MPIKPENRRFYGKEWHEIADYIKWDRAGGCCEDCGAIHSTLVIRSTRDPRLWVFWDWRDGGHRAPDGTPIHPDNLPDEFCHARVTQVVLTVAHLNHNPANNDETNLRALCAACHLRYDHDHHLQNANRTRAEKKQRAVEAKRRRWERAVMGEDDFDLA